MTLGEAIRLCRTQCNMTQIELANAIGVTDGYLSLIERGKRDLRFSTIKKIACALDMPVFLLVYFSDQDTERFNPELREKLAHAALEILTNEH